MNNTEKRRRKLLEQTRNLYSDKKNVPAVHPRYKAAYQKIYPDDTQMLAGTFGIRTFICIFVFALFVLIDYSGSEILDMNSIQILQEIMQNITYL